MAKSYDFEVSRQSLVQLSGYEPYIALDFGSFGVAMERHGDFIYFRVTFDEDDVPCITDDVVAERKRQTNLVFAGVPAEDYDKNNTKNDWVAYITAYAGRATDCHRNEKDRLSFRNNLVKAAALCLAAIEAHDKGYC